MVPAITYFKISSSWKQTKKLSYPKDTEILDQKPYYVFHLMDGDIIPSIYTKFPGIDVIKKKHIQLQSRR